MNDNKQEKKSERTLLTALLMSAPGPLLTGIAAITSHSATQMADFLRRTAELVASFSSWWIFRKLRKNPAATVQTRLQQERLAEIIVAIAMLCSGAALFIVGFLRLFSYTPSGNVITGLVIAALGLVANSIFWLRYRSIARRSQNAVIAAQQRLYRAKTCVDLCVVAALLAVAIAPLHPATQYIDAFGSMVVSLYLGWNGIKTLLASRRRPTD